MDLRPTEEQHELVASFAKLYSDLAGPAAVQSAEEGDPAGHDAVLWRRLLDTGAVAMAVPEAAGGFGADPLDLALVAEQHGRHVAPAPLIEAQVAARLLGEYGEVPGDVLTGVRLVTLAVRPVAGRTARMVPAGAIAEEVIVLRDGCLVRHAVREAVPVRNLGCLPLADLVLDDAGTVLAEGAIAASRYARAVDEWRVLTAAALVGLAGRALELGVEYVKERHAFGRPIGGFQAVAHTLADRVTEVEGAQLLTRKAAWAATEDPDLAARLAPLALAFAAETARATAYDALHFHGGYGFMLEYPVQLYYRRAHAWPGVLESPAAGYRLGATRSRAPESSRERASA